MVRAQPGARIPAGPTALQTYFFILSLDIPSSFFMESLDMLSFDIVSFFVESFDMLSLDMVSLLIESVLPMLSLVAVWAKAVGAPASESDIRPANRDVTIRERVISWILLRTFDRGDVHPHRS